MMLNETLLRQLYVEEQRSMREIAVLMDVRPRVVYDAMMRYRIPRRPFGPKARPGRQVLTVGSLDKTTACRMYVEEGLSIAQIAAAAHCSLTTVRRALIGWNIPRRRRGPR